jgi:hypothetical protein
MDATNTKPAALDNAALDNALRASLDADKAAGGAASATTEALFAERTRRNAARIAAAFAPSTVRVRGLTAAETRWAARAIEEAGLSDVDVDMSGIKWGRSWVEATPAQLAQIVDALACMPEVFAGDTDGNLVTAYPADLPAAFVERLHEQAEACCTAAAEKLADAL